jgi:hypothetical protein
MAITGKGTPSLSLFHPDGAVWLDTGWSRAACRLAAQ